jgi:hypothetical protein
VFAFDGGELEVRTGRGVSEGYGVVARSAIKKGTRLGLYGNGEGTVMSKAAFCDDSYRSQYGVQLRTGGDDMYALDLVTARARYPFGYINSGCYSRHSNVVFNAVRGEPVVYVQARRNIKVGEEILYAYRGAGFMDCRCTKC